MDLQDFFSLDDYEYAALWKKENPLWHPLTNFSSFFSQKTLGKIETYLPESVYIEDPALVFIGKNVFLEPGVCIQGRCIIGDDSIIRHGAYLRGDVVTGKRCIIGHNTEVKSSILLNDVRAAHFAYIGDSIIGNGSNLGAGVKCANLRLDEKEVLVHYKDKMIQSGLKKFGAIIGDRVQIGCNAVLNPGTLIGKNTLCYPLLSLKGYIPPKSTIKQ